jgi:hypothetical protein
MQRLAPEDWPQRRIILIPERAGYLPETCSGPTRSWYACARNQRTRADRGSQTLGYLKPWAKCLSTTAMEVEHRHEVALLHLRTECQRS